MVAGTVAGDLSTLSETRRNATTVAERDCVLWKLDRKALGRLEKEEPETARRFVRIVLKGECDFLMRGLQERASFDVGWRGTEGNPAGRSVNCSSTQSWGFPDVWEQQKRQAYSWIIC